jgi:RNA polymerase sigma-70 factor (ECF subfamily)
MSQINHEDVLGEAKRCDPRIDFSESLTTMSVEEKRRMLKAFPIEIPDSMRSCVDKSDVVQEVLLKIAENDYQLDEMKPQEQRVFLRKMLSSRIVDVIRHHCSFKRDIRRNRPIETEPQSNYSTPSSILVGKENQKVIQLAMSQLLADYQTVLRLRHQDGLTFAQIGLIMGRSPQAARALWGRALVELSRRVTP